MNSREKILGAVKANKPEKHAIPGTTVISPLAYPDKVEQFKKVLENIGGSLIEVQTVDEISVYVNEHFPAGRNLVTTLAEVKGLSMIVPEDDPHQLEVVELALLQAGLGVAENGAVWLTENDLGVRALAFICQHLAVVLYRKDIVNNMHEAYSIIGSSDYNFGIFIAGPSKTADIEQSLVLGAHGPRTMTVFLI